MFKKALRLLFIIIYSN